MPRSSSYNLILLASVIFMTIFALFSFSIELANSVLINKTSWSLDVTNTLISLVGIIVTLVLAVKYYKIKHKMLSWILFFLIIALDLHMLIISSLNVIDKIDYYIEQSRIIYSVAPHKDVLNAFKYEALEAVCILIFYIFSYSLILFSIIKTILWKRKEETAEMLNNNQGM